MCYDIKKYEDIKKKDFDNIDAINQVINSYELDDLVTYREFRGNEDEIRFRYSVKCSSTCPDLSVESVFHAFTHYKYMAELTFANLNQISILRVFMKIHRDFQLEEYLIKFNGEIKFNLKHISSGFNYYITLDFSEEDLIITKAFYNI